MQNLFFLSFVLFASTLVAGLICRWLRLPTVLGYITVGIILGSSIAGLIGEGVTLDFVAEAGVVLLLFLVGLEFSLTEFWADRKNILLSGGAQGALVGTIVGLAVWQVGWGIETSILLGAATAMSSTALTAKQLSDQGEITTRPGRLAITVLVFQDLAAIPLLALLAIWQKGGDPSFIEVTAEVAKVIALFSIALALVRPLLHRSLVFVYRHGSPEILVLAALTIVALAAESAYLAGASAALGAFLAGLVLGESDVRHRIEEDLRPFRDVFASFFFVSIGLQLDLTAILASPLVVIAWLAVLIPAKSALNVLALRASGVSPRDAMQTGIILGHGGEFGLLLVASAISSGVLDGVSGQPFLVALVLSMGIGPVLIRYNKPIGDFIARDRDGDRIQPEAEEHTAHAHAKNMHDHVIVCGAGRIGRTIARAAMKAGVPLIIIEADLTAYRIAKNEGFPVILGDASRIATLSAAGAERARLLVLAPMNRTRADRILDWFLTKNTTGLAIACLRRLVLKESWREHARIQLVDPELDVGLDVAGLVLSELGVPPQTGERIIDELREQAVHLRQQ